MNEIDEKLSEAIGLLFEGQFKKARHNCSEIALEINNPLDQRLIAAHVVTCLCYINQEKIDLAEDHYFRHELASSIQLISDARNFQFATQLQSELKCYNDLLQTYINKFISFVQIKKTKEELNQLHYYWNSEQCQKFISWFNLLLKKYPSPEVQILIYGVRACCYAQNEEYREEAQQDIGVVLFLDKQLSHHGLENAELFWISDIAPMLRDVARLPIFNYNNAEQVLSHVQNIYQILDNHEERISSNTEQTGSNKRILEDHEERFEAGEQRVDKLEERVKKLEFADMRSWLEDQSVAITSHYKGFIAILLAKYQVASLEAHGFLREDAPDVSCKSFVKKFLCCICKTGGTALVFATPFGGVFNAIANNGWDLINEMIAAKQWKENMIEQAKIARIAISEADMEHVINELAKKIYIDEVKKAQIEAIKKLEHNKAFKNYDLINETFTDILSEAFERGEIFALGAYHGLYLIEAVKRGILPDAPNYNFETETTVNILFDCLSETFPDPAPQLVAENSHHLDNAESL